MADITLRLRHNPKTGKREILIGYESDADELPHEHERDHRALVEELLGIKLDSETDEIIVERISKGEVTGAASAEQTTERKAETNRG